MMGILKYKVFNSSKEFEEWQTETQNGLEIHQISPMVLETRSVEIETPKGRKSGARGSVQVLVVYSQNIEEGSL